MNFLNLGDNRWEKWNLNVDDTNFELAGAPERTWTFNLLIRSHNIGITRNNKDYNINTLKLFTFPVLSPFILCIYPSLEREWNEKEILFYSKTLHPGGHKIRPRWLTDSSVHLHGGGILNQHKSRTPFDKSKTAIFSYRFILVDAWKINLAGKRPFLSLSQQQDLQSLHLSSIKGVDQWAIV